MKSRLLGIICSIAFIILTSPALAANIFYACADQNGEIKSSSITINVQPKCNKKQQIVSWNEAGPQVPLPGMVVAKDGNGDTIGTVAGAFNGSNLGIIQGFVVILTPQQYLVQVDQSSPVNQPLAFVYYDRPDCLGNAYTLTATPGWVLTGIFDGALWYVPRDAVLEQVEIGSYGSPQNCTNRTATLTNAAILLPNDPEVTGVPNTRYPMPVYPAPITIERQP